MIAPTIKTDQPFPRKHSSYAFLDELAVGYSAHFACEDAEDMKYRRALISSAISIRKQRDIKKYGQPQAIFSVRKTGDASFGVWRTE